MNIAFLVEMGWKSAVIAGVALAALRLLRSRSAADRAAVLQLTVVTLLLLPTLSLTLPHLKIDGPVAAQPVPVSAAFVPTESAVAVPSPPASAPATPWTPPPLAPSLALVYAAGVLLLGGRMAAGLLTLNAWTRRGRHVDSPEWTGALARTRAATRIDADVRLLVCDHIPSPMSWGLFKPAILIDRASLSRSEDIDAILAHEAAHVARRDWAVLMMSRAAVTLFWFNPLVWMLERALVQEAEEAADRHAIERVEPLRYASTLVACVRHAGARVASVPANSIAPRQGLKRRVEAILDHERRARASGSLLTAGAMVLCVALSAPVAALELVAARPPAAPAPPAPAAPPQPFARADRPAPASARRPPAAEAAPATPDAPSPPSLPATADVPSPPAPAEAATTSAAPLALISPDELIQMRVQGVDETYIAELARIGPRFRALSIGQYVALKVQGVTPAFARQLAEVGYPDLTPEQLVQARIFDVSAADLKAYAQLGYLNLPYKQVIEMAVHRVTADFIRDMAAVGYPNLTPHQLVQMRIFGITPDTARRAGANQPRPSPDALIKMKIFGAI